MKERSSLLLTILRELQKEGLLNELILIGSWCQYFYRIYFDNSPEIPLVRTLDVDFLIPNQKRIRKEVNVPEILERLNFESLLEYPSGYVTFVHPELSVEFLIPEYGRHRSKPYEIKKLHINAQGLRFLSILRDYVIKIRYEDITIRVPEPAAYVLHKFIISKRRLKEEKAERDLLSAVQIGEFLLRDKGHSRRLKEILGDFPKKWQAKVINSSKDKSAALYNLLCKQNA